MTLYIDCEGEPIQEFSALYVDSDTDEIRDVFHAHVAYPFPDYDYDNWSRRHVHGLNLDFLSKHGFENQDDLLSAFRDWLSTHSYKNIYANAPQKEKQFLSLHIDDVKLPPWKQRGSCLSHRLTLVLKRKSVPICNVSCNAHSSYVKWKAKRPFSLTPSDVAKQDFGFHCSLYDCLEIYFYHSE